MNVTLKRGAMKGYIYQQKLLFIFVLELQNFRKPPNQRQIPQDVSGLSQLAGDVRAALFAPLIAGFGSAGQSCPRV